MQTETIEKIKVCLNAIDSALKTFVLREHEGKRFGPEEEYTAKSLKAGLNAVLSDIRALTKAHAKFVRLSTHRERSRIANVLNQINSNLGGQNYPSVATDLDELKSIVRQYNFRTSSESEEILNDRINEIHGMRSKLEEDIDEVGKIGTRAREAEENIQSAESRYAILDEIHGKLVEKSNQMRALHEQDQGRSEEIADLLTNAKSNEGTLGHLAARVGERETQLDEQQRKTSQYETHLAEYKKQHEEIQDEAHALTKSAAQALSDAAAASLSGSIHERYKEEEGKKWWNLFWLFGSAAFAVIAMVLGYYMIAGQENITLGAAVARIAIMSVAVSAAWFCASQYVRYRNTVDDYGYKSVLARSIVAFLGQFTDPEERADYLKIVLGQIHQDPMRKKHDVDVPATQIFRSIKERKNRKPAKVPTDSVDDE